MQRYSLPFNSRFTACENFSTIPFVLLFFRYLTQVKQHLALWPVTYPSSIRHFILQVLQYSKHQVPFFFGYVASPDTSRLCGLSLTITNSINVSGLLMSALSCQPAKKRTERLLPVALSAPRPSPLRKKNGEGRVAKERYKVLSSLTTPATALFMF